MKKIVALLFTISISGQFLRGQAGTDSCRLRCPENMVVTAEKGREGAVVNFTAASASGECQSLSYSPASGSFFRLGSHSVTVSSTSGAKCAFTVTVTDNETPVLTPLTTSPKKLWPASNKMKKVFVNYAAMDNAGETNTVLSVYSNDTDSTNRDWEIIDNHLLRLRASRLASGAPRIYTITVTVTDEAGNKTTRKTSIAVSKTMTAVQPASPSK